MRFAWFGLAALVVLSGCRSAYVEADIENASGSPISLVEVDYPSASFGVGALAPGAKYHYRFKILGSGATKVLWTDSLRKEHSAAGPNLNEGQEGTVIITIGRDSAQWQKSLHP